MKNLLLSLSIIVFCTVSSFAGSLVVENNLNSGAGSLRQAVIDANNGDTILVNVAGTITLTSPIDIFGYSGLTIIGPYPTHLSITSGGSFNGSMFDIQGSEEIYIHNLGFVSSNGTSNAIGAVGNGGPIFIKHCLFEGVSNNSEGGAIFLDASDLTIDNCSFISNSSVSGGGAIWVESGNLYATNNTFAGNNSSGQGGAVYFNGGYYGQFMHNTFKENFAAQGQVMHSGSGGGTIELYANAGDGNGAGQQFDGPGVYLSNGGNVIRLNGGVDFAPWGFSSGDAANTGIQGFLHVPIVTDGYGLKYYTITNCNSDFVDVALPGLAGPPSDARRAPRNLSGGCLIVSGPNAAPIADAGAIEYTKLRVLNNDGSTLTPNSLPWCLNQNLDFVNYIEFDGGAMIIDPVIPLNVSTTAYIIDGYSQTGTKIAGPEFTGNSGVQGAAIDIEISNGAGITTGMIINSTASNSRVSGLRITGFDQFGMIISAASNVKIQGNEIGLTAGGSLLPNGECGLFFVGGINSQVGGAQHWQRNIISGNGGAGENANVFIDPLSVDNIVVGNFIGVSPTGMNGFLGAPLGSSGVKNQGQGTTIGGLGYLGGNIISSHPADGIQDVGSAGTSIIHNKIGMDYEGIMAIQNFNGILVNGTSSGMTIGGLNVDKSRNIISGNTNNNVFLRDCNNIVIEGNYIGPDVTGNNGPGGTQHGILIDAANVYDITIGTAGASNSVNTISANINGIHVINSSGNIGIYNNHIGTSWDGFNALPNTDKGVWIESGAFAMSVGLSGSANVISGNNGPGIHVDFSSGHFIQGNYIGTNASGSGPLGNGDGVLIEGSTNIFIGGLYGVGEGNTIGSNNNNGIDVNQNSNNIFIQGNTIGMDVGGSTPLANITNGVKVQNSTNVTIGGNTANGNIISGHNGPGDAGIFLEGTGSALISGNRIGTNALGSIGHGNETGILITDAVAANIGGIIGNENLICASSLAGITVSSPNVSINGNIIGIGLSNETLGMGNAEGVTVQTNNCQIGNLGTNYVNYFCNNGIGVHFNNEFADLGTVDNSHFGINPAGIPSGNTNYGIRIFQGDSTQIGAVYTCYFQANAGAGILIEDAATYNEVLNCEIGDIGNQAGSPNGIGIHLFNGPNNNVLGGPLFISGNQIVNNTNQGILLENSNFNLIQANRIGIDFADNAGGNAIGVQLIGSSNNIIGGDHTGGGEFHNVISYNNNEGILLDASDDNHIYGNYIGMTTNGLNPAPNTDGISLINNCTFNLIGNTSGNLDQANVISGNAGIGVLIDDSDNNDIFFNNIGVDLTGITPVNAQPEGIFLMNGSQNNTIGGTKSVEGNVISGNVNFGIIIDNSPSNFVEGNYIGKNSTQNVGISIVGAASLGNIIGAAPAHQYGNVIIDNASFGIEIVTDANGNLITQNYIGINPSSNSISGVGTQAIGVAIHSGAGGNNLVGNNVLNGGNIISGNDVGVQIESDDQYVYANFIGTDTLGMAAVPNNVAGVVISNGAQNVLVGGPGGNDHNLISANPIGVHIIDPGTNDNYVYGNNIGMNVNQSDTLANTIGIGIENGPSGNYVGQAGAVNSNDISGNHHGVLIDNASGNYVYNNRIGVDFHNYFGVTIQNGSTSNYVGSGVAERNIIANNDTSGVAIYLSSGNYVLGNYIGMLSDGTTPAGNGIGIYGNGATGNFIGTNTTTDHGNLISASGFAGIAFEAASDGNFFQNNFIGTDYTGNDTVPGSPNGYGMYFDGCDNNTIGGDWLTDEGNVISGNIVDGISFINTTGSYIHGNNIGLSKNNLSFLGNGDVGIRFENGSDGNFIGAIGNGYENIVTANHHGIEMEFSSSNWVGNNFIGNDDTGGESVLPTGVNDQQIGILLDSGCVSNVITAKNVVSGNTLVGIGLVGGGCTDNQVTGNHIGVTFGGNVSYANDSVNVYIGDGATKNLIGGVNPGDKNILGGDAAAHIFIEGPNTDSNQVAGNNIGLAFDNSTTFDSDFGVVINQGNENTIGGSFAGEGNNICDFNENGILIIASNGNQILGNRIGIKPDNSAAPIDSAGVSLRGGDGTWIGSYLPASDSMNIITNCNRGVEIRTTGLLNNTYGSVVGGNSIYNNTNQGIDINADDMVLPIDTANNNAFLNNGEIDRCEILTAWNCGLNGYTHIGFKFYASNMIAGYNIQVYRNPVPDGSGYGEGEIYLGNYVFNPGSPYDTIDIDLGINLPVGTVLTATITGVLGNTSEFSEQYTVTNPPTTPTVNPVTESCLGANDGQLEIDAPEAYYFSTDGFLTWTYGDQADTLINQLPGTYSVEAQYLNGCTQNVSVNLPAGNPLDLGYTMIPDTCGLGVGSIEFDTIPTNLSGGSGDYVYSYDSGTNYVNNIGIFGLTTTTFDLVIQDNVLGCYSLVQNVVVTEINDVVDETFYYSDFCPGNLVFPDSTETAGGTWSFGPPPGDGAMINTVTGEITNAVIGNTYNVVYTVGQCNEDDTLTITAAAVDDASFTYSDFCVGTMPTVSPTNPGGTFNLISGTGAIDSLTGVITAPSGTYQVEYTTNGTCPNKDTVSVNIFAQPAAPVITAIDSVYCPGEALQAMSTSGSDSYAWYDDPALSNVVSTTTSFTPTAIVTGDNYFYITSQNVNGCVSLPDSMNYILVDLSGMYSGVDQHVCIGSTIQLEAFGGETYVWNTSLQILDDLTIDNPTAAINMAEDFIVTITDTNGCIVIDTTAVTLIPQDSCHVDVYNAFSPNNDGTNDFWIIDGIEGFPENTVIIYNRWGDPIISFENYDNSIVVWDGLNKNNKIVPAGTYFYVVEVGGTRNQAGWVQVMR